MDEIFKPIDGFPDYEVSNLGNVRSHKYLKPRMLKPRPTSKGNYLGVTLRTPQKTSFSVSVHTLVLNAFVGPRPKGCVCLHKNNDGHDNRLCNLSWGTQAENLQQATREGRHIMPTRKLTKEQVEFIRQSDLSCKKLGLMFGINHETIHRVKTHKTYNHFRDD